MPNAPVIFEIKPGRSAAEARVHLGFAASDMIIHRIDRKPATCDSPTPDTPISNFDVFAQTWAEQYGFFKEKKVDWAAVIAGCQKYGGTVWPENRWAVKDEDRLKYAFRPY